MAEFDRLLKQARVGGAHLCDVMMFHNLGAFSI
jgi:hypothetical protein